MSKTKKPIPTCISAYRASDGSLRSSYPSGVRILVPAPTLVDPTPVVDPHAALDKALESVKAARAAIAQITIPEAEPDERRKHAEWYPLLRRMVLAQIKGDYEAGERFNLILQEHGVPNSESEFDAFMELAAKAMGVRV